jgi:hypothetical protein
MKFAHVSARLKAILIAAPMLFVVLYAVDYLWLRFRMSHPQAGQAFEIVRFYWATPIKGGKEEIFFDQPQTETCARAIFPHLGYSSCWYSEHKTVRVIR